MRHALAWPWKVDCYPRPSESLRLRGDQTVLLVSHKYSGSVALRLNPIEHRVRSKAVVIDGRKEWARRHMFGRAPRAEGVRLTFLQGYEANMCKRCHRRMDAAGQHYLLQVMKRTKCWRTMPSGQKKQLRELREEVKRLKSAVRRHK